MFAKFCYFSPRFLKNVAGIAGNSRYVPGASEFVYSLLSLSLWSVIFQKNSEYVETIEMSFCNAEKQSNLERNHEFEKHERWEGSQIGNGNCAITPARRRNCAT